MERLKIIINGEKRSFVIPMEYEAALDLLEIKEFQVDPMPEEGEDLSKDAVLYLAELIVNTLQPKDKGNGKDTSDSQ